jgi:hypothetical protein
VLPGASAAEQAQHAFVVGADRGFLVAAGFLAATAVLLLVAIRPQRRPTQAAAAGPAVTTAEAATEPVSA